MYKIQIPASKFHIYLYITLKEAHTRERARMHACMYISLVIIVRIF